MHTCDISTSIHMWFQLDIIYTEIEVTFEIENALNEFTNIGEQKEEKLLFNATAYEVKSINTLQFGRNIIPCCAKWSFRGS